VLPYATGPTNANVEMVSEWGGGGEEKGQKKKNPTVKKKKKILKKKIKKYFLKQKTENGEKNWFFSKNKV